MTSRSRKSASRALDRCAATSSAWTPHTIRKHVTRITTEYGISASPVEMREFVHLATRLAVSDCFSILPEHAARPDHVAHHVVSALQKPKPGCVTSSPPQPRTGSAAPGCCGSLVCAGAGCGSVAGCRGDCVDRPLVIVERQRGRGRRRCCAAIDTHRSGQAGTGGRSHEEGRQVAGEYCTPPIPPRPRARTRFPVERRRRWTPSLSATLTGTAGVLTTARPRTRDSPW